MRILVTGSRNWLERDVIVEAMLDLNNWYDIDWDDVTVVQGDCKTGADYMVKYWAESVGLNVESHPADWKKYGKAAGPKRNQEMVDLGADIVLVFRQPGSRGTNHCYGKAVDAGLPVVLYDEIRNPDTNEYIGLMVTTENGAKATAKDKLITPLKEATESN